ncbi:hypothetical protein ACFWA5_04840 [Streptomyces mirabilis]|uniref:hypothetical protein n=1 Tax=Streptomyces mirabilis TaxID=68239 RepID=UPI00365DED2F
MSGVSPVEMLVERPALPGTEQVAVWWGYFDELASWTWDAEPGRDGEWIGRTTLGTVGAPAALRLVPASRISPRAETTSRTCSSKRQPRRHTWHGQALAILRPAKRPGRVTLTASAPGLRPTARTLTVGQQRARSDRGQP